MLWSQFCCRGYLESPELRKSHRPRPPILCIPPPPFLEPLGSCTSAFFGYRKGERLAIAIGAVSGPSLLISCALLAYVARFSELSREDTYLAWFGTIAAGVPALCIFLGSLAGYIAMGFLGSAREED